MNKVRLDSLEVGKMVRIDNQGLPYKIVGMSCGDSIFLVRSSFLDRPYNQNAIQVSVGDINAVLS